MDTGDETFWKAVGIITVGMTLPAFPVALAGDLLVASFSYEAFLGMLGIGFGIVVVVLLEWTSLDRISFGFVVVFWPWVVYLTAIFGVLFLKGDEQIPQGPIANIVRILYGYDWVRHTETTEFVYGAVFMLAGLGAVGVSSLLRRRTFQQTE